MKANQHGFQSWHGKLNTFVTALVFIVVGLMFIGRNLGIVDPYWFCVIVSWQMLLVVIGVTHLIKRKFWGGFTFLAIGSFFLFPEIIDGNFFETFWPLIFIIIGISLLFKRKSHQSWECSWDKRGRGENQEGAYTSADGFVTSDNTFGSVQQIVLDPAFKGARLKCTFGGTVLDLRRTKLESPETCIEVECTFGGIEILVPGDWNIQTQIQTAMGECVDKRYNVIQTIDTEHILVIQGKVTFGSVELKN